VYIDPYLNASDRRLSPPPFAPAAVTKADLVVRTHNHRDHVDPQTLPILTAASPSARFVAPGPIHRAAVCLVG
jgi:L-ascorbate metabolism protein UlaG (beta-lactamase superfamily)